MPGKTGDIYGKKDDFKSVDSINNNTTGSITYRGSIHAQNFNNSTSQTLPSDTAGVFVPFYYRASFKTQTETPYLNANLSENKFNSKTTSEQAYDPLADNNINNYDISCFKKQKAFESNSKNQAQVSNNTNFTVNQSTNYQKNYGRQKFKANYGTTQNNNKNSLNEVSATYLVNKLSFEQYRSKCILSCTNQEDSKAIEEYLNTLEPYSGEKNWDGIPISSAMNAINLQKNEKLNQSYNQLSAETNASLSQEEYASCDFYGNTSVMSNNQLNSNFHQIKTNNQNVKSNITTSVNRSAVSYSSIIEDKVIETNKKSLYTNETYNTKSAKNQHSSFSSYKKKRGTTNTSDEQNIEILLPVEPTELIAKRREKFRVTTKNTVNKNNKKLSEENYNFDYQIVGTCEDIEKPYLRLTTLPDPSQIRSESVLKKALLNVKTKHELSADPHYIWEQMKSIRQDLTVQNINNGFTIEVYEYHARLCLQSQDWKEFKECITKLRQLYQHYLIKGNEAEFTAYHILYTILVGNVCETNLVLDQLPEHLVDELSVSHALKVLNFYMSGNWYKFFKITKDTPNLGIFIIKKIAKNIRIQSLLSIFKSHKMVISVSYVQNTLGFESQKKCLQYLEKRNCCVTSENMIDPKRSITSLLNYIKNLEFSKS